MISLGKFSNSNTSKEVILEKLENGCIKCLSHCTDKDGYVRIMYNGKHVWEDSGDGRTYSGHPI